MLAEVSHSDYVERLKGTLGADPSTLNFARGTVLANLNHDLSAGHTKAA
jgi:hypothetical protein